jgi:transcription initiation factor IIE alpha subunit
MDAIQFTLRQLLTHSVHNTEEKPTGKRITVLTKRKEEAKNKVILFLQKNGGATNDECAEYLGNSPFSVRNYLQALVNENRAIMQMQPHNKPAIYKAK